MTMLENNQRPRSFRPLLKSVALLLCLLAPSIWMLATIPPLWRDADAYVQLTQDPRVATFWGHAPAYCYVAKVPLFLGEQLERMRGLAPAPRTVAGQVPLTDTGIYLLLLGQHLGLALAVYLFITTVTRHFWVRLALSLAWASAALFYTFAHCLGSETLGMILIVLLAWKGLELIQARREPTWNEWYVWALILVLCLLARDLNLGLVALLPAAFVVAATIAPFVRRERFATSRYCLRQFVIALALGLACLFTAHSITQRLAHKTKLHPHSRLGFTFLWRLRSLDELPPEKRAAAIQRVTARTQSPSVRNLIALLEQMHAEGANLEDPRPFLERAIPLFGGSRHWEDLDLALKQMAFAFLWPPLPELVAAMRADFAVGMRAPPTLTSQYLFATTGYYFQHQTDMPACANLVTFRGTSADRLWQIQSQHRYFQFWDFLSYRQLLLLWLIALGALLLAARHARLEITAVVAYGCALSGTGLLLFAATCVLHNYEPRFSLPMWELLLLSVFLFVGKTADALILRRRAGAEV